MSFDPTLGGTIAAGRLRSFRRQFGLLGCAAFALGALLLTGGSKAYAYVTYADSADFTVNTAGIQLNIGGAAQADSANFTVNTLGLNPDIGGAAQADSANFSLNTRVGTSLAIGGVASADSAYFMVNTVFGTPLAIGGTARADSGNFTVNTVFGTVQAIGGVAHADSANFTVSTRFGTITAVGGADFADSADFTVNTTGISRITNISTNLGIALNGSSLSISWPSAAGSFSLQYTTNLTPPNWQTLSNPPATVGSNFISTVAATNPIEFFRLKSN
jgi:hypothetical protein